MESSQPSVSEWLSRLKRGDGDAAQRLWERYYSQLIRESHRKMGDLPHRTEDANDVAAMAFTAFLTAVQKRRFPQLDDRDDLWQILLMLVERRATDVVRKETAEMRGGGHVVREGDLVGGESTTGSPQGLDRLPCPTPSPQTIDELATVIRERWKTLNEPTLCQIALEKLQGYTNDEVAKRLGIALRSVERKLRLIKDVLSAPIS